MTLGDLVKETEEKKNRKKRFLESWRNLEVTPEPPKKTVVDEIVDTTIRPKEPIETNESHWVEVFTFNNNDITIEPTDSWNYRLIVKKIIHTPKSTKLFLVEVKNEVEYEQTSMIFRNEFFCDDFNFLCDMIREQLEHKFKAEIEIDLKTLFKATL